MKTSVNAKLGDSIPQAEVTTMQAQPLQPTSNRALLAFFLANTPVGPQHERTRSRSALLHARIRVRIRRRPAAPS